MKMMNMTLIFGMKIIMRQSKKNKISMMMMSLRYKKYRDSKL